MAGGISYEVTGAGYNPQMGEILFEGNSFAPGNSPALVECLRAGVLCNDSLLLNNGDNWQVQGDPTEGGLFVPALKEPGYLDIHDKVGS